MPASEDLFMSDRHPISKRWAIVEDDGRVAWLYLTEPGTEKPAADCWLYNRVPTPPQFDSARGEMPVVPATQPRLAPPEIRHLRSLCIFVGRPMENQSLCCSIPS